MPPSRMQSPGFKMVALVLLQLLLLVPLLQVQGLVHERSNRMHEAEGGIGAQWGRAQLLAPAYLVIDMPSQEADGRPIPHRDLVLLPDTVTIEGELHPEWRHRGIYKVPVYTGELKVFARFSAADLTRFAAVVGAASKPRLRLGVSDARGIRALSALRVGSRDLVAESAGRELGDMDVLSVTLDQVDVASDLALSYTLTLAGSESFYVLPLGRDTRFDLAGPWPDPSFNGAFLPATRELGAQGFRAHWQVLGFNRAIPQRFWLDAAPVPELRNSGFGLDLYRSNDIYQQNERTGKYDVLIGALVFLALFLFETIAGVALHPIQYAFIGLALALFYLMLIAFSEHIGFGPAYLAASISATLLVAGYARAALGSGSRAALLAGLQGGAYGVFFVLVQSDDYALLLGASVLFVVLAIAMYLTRRVDWYGLART